MTPPRPRSGLGFVLAGLLVLAVAVLLRPGVGWTVIGDTTTTMMWLDGMDPADLFWSLGFLLLGSILVILGWRRALRGAPPA